MEIIVIPSALLPNFVQTLRKMDTDSDNIDMTMTMKRSEKFWKFLSIQIANTNIFDRYLLHYVIDVRSCEYHHDRDLIPIFMCDMIETKYCCQFTDRSVLSTETDSCLSLSIKYDQEELRIHIVKFKYIPSWVTFVTCEIERHAICDTLYFPSRRDVKIFFRTQYFFIESLRIMNMCGKKKSTKNIKVNQQITFDIDYNASTWTSEDIFGSSVDLRHRPRYGNISKNHVYLSSIVHISFWIFLLSSPNTSFLCVLSRSNLSIFPRSLSKTSRHMIGLLRLVFDSHRRYDGVFKIFRMDIIIISSIWIIIVREIIPIEIGMDTSIWSWHFLHRLQWFWNEWDDHWRSTRIPYGNSYDI